MRWRGCEGRSFEEGIRDWGLGIGIGARGGPAPRGGAIEILGEGTGVPIGWVLGLGTWGLGLGT